LCKPDVKTHCSSKKCTFGKIFILSAYNTKPLISLFEKWAGEKASEIHELPESGSYRKYFRIKGRMYHAIGAFYDSPQENHAFIELSRHFKANGMNVPEIYAVDEATNTYLMEDLGDTVLFDHINELRQKEGFSTKLINIYRSIINELIRFQMLAGKTVDYSVCYPAAEFDGQSYMWDLNYFKYNFLKLAQIPFDEYRLEEDFRKMVQLLLSADNSYFVYRDFQVRNIMLHQGKLFFIDYQGGRKGPLYYDLVSLLFQARARIPHEIREELIDYYIKEAGKINPGSVDNFRQYFYKFALVRILQTLGAYGFRGLHEKKPHFLESLPMAIENVDWLISNLKISTDIPELKHCLKLMIGMNEAKKFDLPALKIQINSFSYKRGIPVDLSGNGGGFVFDCRALPNPGRQEEYRELTGLDKKVANYLSNYKEVDQFIEQAFTMVQQSAKIYSERHFINLMVNFGCTGGQHRSVYCAEQLAQKLKVMKHVDIELRHREQE
jgi:aminoglycoside/choline kinase family phosphotransferase